MPFVARAQILRHYDKTMGATVVVALFFFATILNVSADEQLTQDQTTLGTWSFSGSTTSTIAIGKHRHRSGIAGQVFLITPILNLNGGLEDYYSEPIQLHLWIIAKIGDHFRHVGSLGTAQDGTFSFDAAPGTYSVEPDPTSGYTLGGVIGRYTDTLEISVLPRQITYDEICVVSDPFPSLFP